MADQCCLYLNRADTRGKRKRASAPPALAGPHNPPFRRRRRASLLPDCPPIRPTVRGLMPLAPTFFLLLGRNAPLTSPRPPRRASDPSAVKAGTLWGEGLY